MCNAGLNVNQRPRHSMDVSEDPTPIRPKTWSFYITLFVAVLPLWSSVPLAWIFTAHSLIAGSFSILFYLALGEVSGHRSPRVIYPVLAHGFDRSYLVFTIFISLTMYPASRPVDQQILRRFKLLIYAC